MEISKRDWIAMQVDITPYNPFETLKCKLGRGPLLKELAEYIAAIRYVEADAVLDHIEKE